MRTLGKDTSCLRHGGTQEGYIMSQENSSSIDKMAGTCT